MIAIRDDDLSFWTDVCEIRSLYGDYLSKGGKVSFAVVPYSVRSFFRGDRSRMFQLKDRKPIYENKALVDYLTPFIKNGQVEIMQHGFDHSYYVALNGDNHFLDEELRCSLGQTSRLVFVPECCAKTNYLLEKELRDGHEILEDTFKTKVNVFVPPSNGLSTESSEIVDKMGLNISGTITRNLNRKMNIYSVFSLMNKVSWKLTHPKLSYPKVMRYKNHLELIGYAFTPSMDNNRFMSQFLYCKENDLPFVIATHYWELNLLSSMRSRFLDLIFEEISSIDIVSKLFSKQED